METSDDEMDIIERAPPRVHTLHTRASAPNERVEDADDDSEEVLTSDPEELAVIMANRSLEKFMKETARSSSPDGANSESRAIADTDQEQDDSMRSPVANESTKHPSPLGPVRSPRRNILPPSSPTQASQSSMDDIEAADDNHVDAPGTPQTAPLTSSPNSVRNRYSPPSHLQYSLPGPKDDNEKIYEMNEGDNSSTHELADNHDQNRSLLPKDWPLMQDRLEFEYNRSQSSNQPQQQRLSPSRSSTIAPLPTSFPPRTGPRTENNQTLSISPAPSTDPVGDIPLVRIPEVQPFPDDAFVPVHGRTLRARTARQQHPYAIEYAHYKRSMLQAGLNDAIIRPQVREHQPSDGSNAKHPRPLDPEMQGFIVPEDEESQDLYVPPPSLPQRDRHSVRDEQPAVNMGDLLAGFGGMLSDDDTPTKRARRKDKGKGEGVPSPKKTLPRPKPFPLNTKPAKVSVTHQSPSPSRQRYDSPSFDSTSPLSHKNRIGVHSSKNSSSIDAAQLSSSDSDAPAKPSHDSDSSDLASSSGLADSLERKRMRILNRMMPTAWIRRQMEQKEAKKHLDHQKRRTLPPTGGTKRNLGNLQKPLVLMGDSESEEETNSALQDDDRPVLPSILSSPVTRPARSSALTCRRRKAQVLSDDNDGDIVEVSSSDERSISSSAIVPKHVDDEEISSWLTRRSPVRSGGGGDLINRMLSRTGEFSRNPKHVPKKQRAGYKQDGTKMKQAKLTSIFRASSPDGEVIELSSDDDKPKGKRAGTGIHLDLSRKQAPKQPRSQRTFTIRSDWAELLDGTMAASTDARRVKDKKSAYNRAASTSNLYIREGQGQPVGSHNSPTRSRASKGHPFDHKSVSTDCGILPFDPHTKFSPSTYIGRGFLQNLVDVVMTADTPSVEAAPVIVFGEHLDTRISGPDFVEKVRFLVSKWTDWLLGQENETEQNVQRSFRYVALTMTHLLEGSASSHPLESAFSSASLDFLEEDATEILKLINVVSQGDPALKDASIESSVSWLSFHWFLVEASARVVCGNHRRTLKISVSAELDSTAFDAAVQLLIRALLSYTISDRLQQIYNSAGDLNDLVLELWVCLIHLVDETRVTGAINWKPLWTRVEQVLDASAFALPYKVFESERRWEHIFAFSALNMFSSQTGRLMPSHPPISRWAWVCKTIKDVRLKEDNNVAETSTRQQRIDFYVRTVMARCWLLHTMWGWNYQHYDRLFTLIYPIFQSRKLAKLRDEKTDFPPFIRHLDLESLDRFSNGDSAWSIFLKVFRRAIIDDPGGARKLYSTCIPIGVLNFTDENPATDMDLSRLLNRFAILLVVLITDPTEDRATDCVKRIQALISFQAADMRSREACIRAFQYAGLLLKFYNLEFTPLVSWMRNMVITLQEGMKKSSSVPQRNRLAVLVLCLLRGVAAIVSTAGFDRDTELEYPETGLLIPELFQLVFQLDMKTNPATRREIRLFLEALCNAREAYIARLPPKPVAPIVQDEESQENYGFDDFDLDLNDPEVLAGLDAVEGDAALPANNSDPLVAKERSTAELVNTTISPAIFENVILGFGLDDRRLSGALERENDTNEEYAWVKVWVGCLKIVVENYLRTWWDYLGSWGGSQQERISRIIDIAAERRVRIQFCYLALKCSPNLAQRASREHKHQLILPWFQCLPHHQYTVEHKYTALICDRGLTSNPMLEGLPCRANERGEHYVLSTELMAERLQYIRRVLENLGRLASANRDNPMSTDVTRGREYIAKLFETMKHTREHLGRPFASSADHNLIPSYLEFCHSVRAIAAELLLEASVKDLCLRLSWVPQPS
ncbi:unnamed protein product [Rhizoctonia solani]|uniref:Uncharacterized protein n=1 Tax=Rhizoctonia solani TaxID=456999 RepID=A0A8H3H3A4_9AGAM|nr:unnamed protein product [Rhizoctonia solani]